MAPCGCYFDPRMYQMQWIHNEFPQSSVCKLIQVPGIKNITNSNWTDSQRYPKNPVQPTAPAHQQHTQERKEHTPSPYNQGDSKNVTRPDNVTSAFQETPQARIPKGKKHGKRKKIRLPDLEITIPGLKQDGNIKQTMADFDLIENFLAQELFQLTSVDKCPQETQKKDSNLEEQTNSSENCQVDNLILDAEGKNICSTKENTPINFPPDLPFNRQSSEEQMNHTHLIGESQAADVPALCLLPNEVLLEDAMKMFDCIPGNVDTEEGNGTLRGGHGPCTDSKNKYEIEDMEVQVPACHSPCKKASLSDLSVLNLPDDLLCADYSVPEICEKMSIMDCYDNIGEIIEIPLWDDHLNSNVIDNLSNQLAKQNSPCAQKKSTFANNVANETCNVPRIYTSSFNCNKDNEEYLDKMESY